MTFLVKNHKGLRNVSEEMIDSISQAMSRFLR